MCCNSAQGPLWLIAWTGWWPSAESCNLPSFTQNYETEGLMGFQVIEPRCLKLWCLKLYGLQGCRAATLFISCLVNFPVSIFMPSWTSQTLKPSSWHTSSKEVIHAHPPVTNSLKIHEHPTFLSRLLGLCFSQGHHNEQPYLHPAAMQSSTSKLLSCI